MFEVLKQDFYYFRSEVIAIVRMAGNNALNVAKLQEQLAKNKTIYTTNTDYNTNSNNIDTGDSVSTNSFGEDI